ncbi:hypothetical protein BD779DRAFT_1672030 [Infundibulicybe gibba]|nr:hypothetical protein BD779DRAFT_1672030 [Infundibulicybe gibba]
MASTASSSKSRFSTLRVFGFSSRDKDAKPPPLPPKDPYYLQNKSLASLTPDSLSIPNSPISLHRDNNPNKSTMSLVSSATSARSFSPAEHRPPKKEKSRLFGFVKRSPKSPPPASTADDDSISLPWNFQHNIHVDEGFAACRLRGPLRSRQPVLTKNRLPLCTPVPCSTPPPASPSPPPTTAHIPHHRRPPRNASLPRQYSLSSLHSDAQRTTTTSDLSFASTITTTTQHAPTPYLYHHSSSDLSLSTDDNSHSPHDTSPEHSTIHPAAEPSTPPRRGFHVTNAEPINSPPPSYTPGPSGYPSDRKDPSLFSTPARTSTPPPRTPVHHTPSPSTSSSTSADAAPVIANTLTESPKRTRTAPSFLPRLSLKDSDLSSWGVDALLSLTTAELTSSGTPAPRLNTTPAPSTPARRPLPSPTATAPTPLRMPPSPSPPASAVSPLMHGFEGVLARGDSQRGAVYASAESESPTLPVSPVKGNVRQEREARNSRASAYSRDEREDKDDSMLDVARDTTRDSSRSSSSTLSAATIMGLSPPTMLRKVSISRGKATAVVVGAAAAAVRRQGQEQAQQKQEQRQPPPSPMSSHFGSEEDGASGSSSERSHDHETPTTEAGPESPLCPSPVRMGAGAGMHPHSGAMRSATDTFGGVTEEDEYEEYEDEESEEEDGSQRASRSAREGRPKIVISNTVAAVPRVAVAVVAPLEEFIDYAVDPRKYYLDLREIAEGESGSVFAARVAAKDPSRLKLPPLTKAKDCDDAGHGRTRTVAIKVVAIPPTGSPKLVDLQRELVLLRGLWHAHVLGMDALYVDLAEDALWIRMELMERSLADVVALKAEGLVLHERVIARFASDVLQALAYLQKHAIAHRDVRSDNLLLNAQGVLKLADFSAAVRVTEDAPMRSDSVGVVYWQAPETRATNAAARPYNALKVDVWSLGATVWELAEGDPPFAATQQLGDTWPPLAHPGAYSRAMHEFLARCSARAEERPRAEELIKSAFVNNACGRVVIAQLLAQCTSIENALQEQGEGEGSDGSDSGS